MAVLSNSIRAQGTGFVQRGFELKGPGFVKEESSSRNPVLSKWIRVQGTRFCQKRGIELKEPGFVKEVSSSRNPVLLKTRNRAQGTWFCQRGFELKEPGFVKEDSRSRKPVLRPRGGGYRNLWAFPLRQLDVDARFRLFCVYLRPPEYKDGHPVVRKTIDLLKHQMKTSRLEVGARYPLTKRIFLPNPTSNGYLLGQQLATPDCLRRQVLNFDPKGDQPLPLGAKLGL